MDTFYVMDTTLFFTEDASDWTTSEPPVSFSTPSPTVLGKHIGLLIIAAIGFVSNLFLIVVLSHFRNLRTLSNRFLLSLAMVNCTVCCPTVPLYICTQLDVFGGIETRQGQLSCMAILCLGFFQKIASQLALLAFTFEKYLLIVHPFVHQKRVTRKSVNGTIVGVWVYSAVVGFLPMTGWNAIKLRNDWGIPQNATYVEFLPNCRYDSIFTGQYMGFEQILHVAVPIIILLIMYFHIIHIIRLMIKKKNKSLKRQLASQSALCDPCGLGSVSPETDAVSQQAIDSRGATINSTIEEQPEPSISTIHLNSEPVIETNNRLSVPSGKRPIRRSNTRQKLESTRASHRIIIPLMCSTMLSWLPTMIYCAVLYNGYTKTLVDRDDVLNSPMPRSYYEISSTLGVAGAMVNPFVCGFGTPAVRQTVVKHFKRCTNRNRN